MFTLFSVESFTKLVKEAIKTVPEQPANDDPAGLFTLLANSADFSRKAAEVTGVDNPVTSTTLGLGRIFLICSDPSIKYPVLCTLWISSAAAGLALQNPGLIATSIQLGSQILEK